MSGFAKELKVVGTGDGVDMLRMVADEYSATKPDMRVEIPPSIGSGGGIAAVGSGRAAVGRIARSLSDSERASKVVAIPIANIPSAFFVNKQVGISALSAADVAGVFEGRFVNWKELGGPDMRIRVVRREDEDSTLGALRAGMPGWKDLALTDKSKVATTTQEAIETVRDTAGAIGFGPFSRQLPSDLTVLRIDGRKPVDPDYPAKVVLSLIYNSELTDKESMDFVTFASSKKAQDIIRSFGAVPTSK